MQGSGSIHEGFSEIASVPFSETPGQHLARIRKERGYTQVELAQRTSLIQTLVSDYERGKLRLNADMPAKPGNRLATD